ncbi:MAG: hypothetical protein JXR76_06760 [Deltaproteobacteria bacterium]|nr:hypothetical protein [Deltaproteobacteria bacterium]
MRFKMETVFLSNESATVCSYPEDAVLNGKVGKQTLVMVALSFSVSSIGLKTLYQSMFARLRQGFGGLTL